MYYLRFYFKNWQIIKIICQFLFKSFLILFNNLRFTTKNYQKICIILQFLL
jgi:hypothetical protein